MMTYKIELIDRVWSRTYSSKNISKKDIEIIEKRLSFLLKIRQSLYTTIGKGQTIDLYDLVYCEKDISVIVTLLKLHNREDIIRKYMDVTGFGERDLSISK